MHQRFEMFHERLEHVYSQAEIPTIPAGSPSSNSSVNREYFRAIRDHLRRAVDASVVLDFRPRVSPIRADSRGSFRSNSSRCAEHDEVTR
jgi:hypothetical protein